MIWNERNERRDEEVSEGVEEERGGTRNKINVHKRRGNIPEQQYPNQH